MGEPKVRFARLTLRSSRASVGVFALGDAVGTMCRFQRLTRSVLIGQLLAMSTACGKDILHLPSAGPGRRRRAESLIGERRHMQIGAYSMCNGRCEKGSLSTQYECETYSHEFQESTLIQFLLVTLKTSAFAVISDYPLDELVVSLPRHLICWLQSLQTCLTS